MHILICILSTLFISVAPVSLSESSVFICRPFSLNVEDMIDDQVTDVPLEMLPLSESSVAHDMPMELEQLLDEPADVAVQNSKSSIHTPPEKEHQSNMTEKPMAFIIDFTDAISGSKKVKSPLKVVDKSTAFTVDVGGEPNSLNMSDDLRDCVPLRVRQGFKTRAAKAKSDKADVSIIIITST